MSEATKEALDAALAAHVADVCSGALISGYVLQAAYFNGDTNRLAADRGPRMGAWSRRQASQQG